jgi:hypothetical protein
MKTIRISNVFTGTNRQDIWNILATFSLSTVIEYDDLGMVINDVPMDFFVGSELLDMVDLITLSGGIISFSEVS